MGLPLVAIKPKAASSMTGLAFLEAGGFLVLGLVLLVAGGEFVLRGTVSLAANLGVSPLLISLTLVALATSLPELMVTLQAGFAEAADLAAGNIFGSNIANLLLILGAAALLRPFTVPRGTISRDGGVMLLASLAVLPLLLTRATSWWLGLVFLTGLGAYLIFSFWQARKQTALERAALAEAEEQAQGQSEITQVASHRDEDEVEEKTLSPWKALALLVIGVIGLLIGADLVVENATEIASALGVSQAVIGVTLVAFGTSLPELATTVIAAIRRHSELALGNVIGSNIMNLLGIFGALTLVTSVDIRGSGLAGDVFFMLAVTLATLLFLLWRPHMGRVMGGLYLSAYCLFMVFEFATS